MSAVLEARAVITAEDKTGKAFEALKARIAAITRQVEALDRVTGSVGSVAKNVDAVAVATGRASGDMARFVSTARSVETVSAAIGNVERSAGAMAATIGRSTAAVAKLSGELFDAGGKLKAIETFRGTSRAVDEASLAMRHAQQDVRRLGVEIAATEQPTKSLQSALDRARADVVQTSDAFKQQGAAAREARAALDMFGIPLNKVRSQEERLKSVVENTTAAIRQQISADREAAVAAEALAKTEAQAARAEERAGQERRRIAERDARDQRMLAERSTREQHRLAEQRTHDAYHESFTRYALTGAAMAVGAGEVVNVGREAWQQGAELNHERIGLQNAGRMPKEIRDIEAAARNVVSTLPTASFTESMKVVAETTQAFGSVEHAVDNLPFMMKTMAVLKAAGGEHIHGSAGDVGRALAKTFEERQTLPQDFEKEASAMIPAMVASGGTFNPEQLYMFAQQAKSALPSLSMRFLSKIAPSLIGAQGGERAGTALNAFESVISGKANDKKQAQEWLKLGLLDPSQVIMKNGQATSWKSGAVKDTFLAMTDPLAWSEKYLIPALQKQGVDTNNREAVKQILDTMFRNQNSNIFASEITQAASRARLHKDEDLINKVGDEDGIYQRNLADFGVAAGALKTALGDLAAATTAPLMRGTAGALSSLAAILNNVARFGFEHPTIAAGTGIAVGTGALYGAGRLSQFAMNGFGLQGSAQALDGSALNLDAAARSLQLAVAEERAGGLPSVVGAGKAGAAGAAEREALAIEGAEVAITGAATLSVTTLMLGALAGAVVIGALSHGPRKHRASDDPDFGDPFAPPHNPLIVGPLPPQPATETPRPSRPGGDHPSGEAGYWVPGTTRSPRHWVASKRLPDDVPRFVRETNFDGGLLPPIAGPEGTNFRFGGAHIDELTGASAFGPAPQPGSSATPFPPLPREPQGPSGPVPVSIVGAPPPFHDGWLDGERPAIEEQSRRGAAMFRRDPEATRGQHMLDHDAEQHDSTLHVDASEAETAVAKVKDVQNHMAALNGVTAGLKIDMGPVDEAIRKLTQLRSLASGAGAGRTSGALGYSYPQTAPTGRMGGPW